MSHHRSPRSRSVGPRGVDKQGSPGGSRALKISPKQRGVQRMPELRSGGPRHAVRWEDPLNPKPPRLQDNVNRGGSSGHSTSFWEARAGLAAWPKCKPHGTRCFQATSLGASGVTISALQEREYRLGKGHIRCPQGRLQEVARPPAQVILGGA